MTALGRGGSLRPRLLLALLAASVFLPGIGARDLWNPDEPRYAQVAKEMRQSGEYLVPHLNGEVYTQKPPLMFWSMSAAATLLGGEMDERAARLPSALAAIATILLVFSMAERIYGRRAAWLAALAFGTCFKILWQGRVGQIDMLLTFLVTLEVWFWLRGFQEGRPGFYRLFFVVAGLATLAKGPAGFLPPLLSIVAFLWWTGQRAELRRMRIGAGFLIWAGVVLAWLVPTALRAGGDYLAEITVTQNLTRYRAPEEFQDVGGHIKPWYYYLTVLPGEFFPWSFLLPAALLGLRRERPPRRSLRLLFPLFWVLVTLLFFSLSPAKRSVYVLPLYPALALLVGGGLDRVAARWPGRRRAFLWGTGAAAGLLGLLTAAIPVVAPRYEELRPLGEGWVWAITGALAVAFAGALGCLVAAWRGRPRRGLIALGAGVALFSIVATLFLMPPYDRLKSPRPLARELLRRLDPEEGYATFPKELPHFLFYIGRHAEVLRDEEELRRWIATTERPWVLARRSDLERIEGPLPLMEVAGDPPRRGGYTLLGLPDGGDGETASGAVEADGPR